MCSKIIFELINGFIFSGIIAEGMAQHHFQLIKSFAEHGWNVIQVKFFLNGPYVCNLQVTLIRSRTIARGKLFCS